MSSTRKLNFTLITERAIFAANQEIKDAQNELKVIEEFSPELVPEIAAVEEAIKQLRHQIEQFSIAPDNTKQLLSDLEMASKHLETSKSAANLANEIAEEKKEFTLKIQKIVEHTALQLEVLKVSFELNSKANPSIDPYYFLFNLTMCTQELLRSLRFLIQDQYDYIVPKDEVYRITQESYQELNEILFPSPVNASPITANQPIAPPISSIATKDDLSYIWLVMAILFGAFIAKPIINRTANVLGYLLFNIFSPLLNRSSHYEPALLEDVIVEQRTPLEIQASNDALIARIQKKIESGSLNLLTEKEIDEFKRVSGYAQLEQYLDVTSCRIHFTPMTNPITLHYQEKRGRSWDYTVDAAALVQHIKQCSILETPAFAPETRDVLDSNKITIENGFDKMEITSLVTNYAAWVRKKLIFWNKQEYKPTNEDKLIPRLRNKLA